MSVFIILSFFHIPFALACEPPPAVGALCGKSKFVSYRGPESMRLLELIRNFEQELLTAIKTDSPDDIIRIGDGSCFLMNSATSYLGQFEAYSKEHKGRICEADIFFAIKEVENLVSRDSKEFKAVKSDSAQAKLKKLSTEILLRLKEFESAHK